MLNNGTVFAEFGNPGSLPRVRGDKLSFQDHGRDVFVMCPFQAAGDRLEPSRALGLPHGFNAVYVVCKKGC